MKPLQISKGDILVLRKDNSDAMAFIVAAITRRGFTAHSINGHSHPNATSPLKLDSKTAKEFWIKGKE